MSWKRTVWFRLTVGSVAIILVANVVLSLVMILSISGMLVEEVQTRVRLDLNSARKVYDRCIGEFCILMRATSARRSVPYPLESWNREDLHRLMQDIRQVGKLDVLSLLGEDGRVIYREHNPGQAGDDASSNPIIARALKERTCVRGTAIVPYKDLLKEGANLAKGATIETKPTREARREEVRTHRAGMFIGAAVPLLDLQKGGEIVGYFYGARLLNHNNAIVDEIKEELYQNETYNGTDIGAATIFQGDIRISTSMKGADGSRAVGTLLSSVVHEKVLEKKETWADRAFVVNDWYISAYEPIRDPADRVIGTLGIGVLEAPFSRTRRLTVGTFIAVVALTTLASLVLLTLATRTVLLPIGRVIKMSDRVVAGDLSARVKMRPPGEMGLLCRAIDQMADAVSQREKALERATRRQIGQSEKMASVGRMAAGIAHEINNPLTGLLTFIHLLQDEKDLSKKGREYLEVMFNETTRMRETVLGLLNFAHEPSSKREPLDINEVIRQGLKLLRSQKGFKGVVIEENLANGLPRVHGDANQLEQVLVNLSLNACEAMAAGGTLSISTSGSEAEVSVAITDTGCGIKDEHLEKIFDPFFTTKPAGKGTGLGLSVSYGIVRQHGGTMEVNSKEGKGTTFTIVLPAVSGK
jgi:two-component system NtrC family sensor kinase